MENSNADRVMARAGRDRMEPQAEGGQGGDTIRRVRKSGEEGLLWEGVTLGPQRWLERWPLDLVL